MFLKKNTNTMRSLYSVFTVLALAVTVLWFGANNSTTNAGANAGDKTEDSPTATFAGTGTGPIEDTPTSGTFGPSRVVSFAVTGVSANVTTVSVNMTLTHTYVGDLDVVLASPGGTRSLVIFSRVGATTAGSFGSDSELGGTYSFSDSATANFWTAATTAAGGTIPAGAYRTTAAGGAGQTNPAPVTSLNATFAGLTPAQANGTWTLTFRDRGAGDVGNVSAANLTVEPTGPVGVTRGTLFDFTGNGRTDFTTLSIASGNIIWNVVANPANPLPNQGLIRRFAFGLAANMGAGVLQDVIVPADYVGDGKTEVAVYRRSNSVYYLAQFPLAPNTGITLDRAVPFGNGATDILGAQGDYDGDGKIDYTVVRVVGGTYNWFILGSVTNTFKAIPFGTFFDSMATPIRGTRVFPGADFTGDGRDELIIISRSATTGIFTYYIGDSNTGAGVMTKSFGDFDDDFSVPPADYTGDGRADFVAVRQTQGAAQIWYINNSVTNVTTGTAFGIPDPNFNRSTDNVLRGDYDGDRRHDIAVYRPGNQTFYWISSANSSSVQSQVAGPAGETPLANFGVF